MFLELYIILLIFAMIYPAILIVYQYSSLNFKDGTILTNIDLGEGLNGFENLKNIGSFGCGGFKFLGYNDSYMDCASICDSNDYRYRFINDSQTFVIGTTRLRGAYCLKSAYAKCNLNTSLAVVGKFGYNCITKFPQLLGGESGNEIIVCDGKIKDNLVNQIYERFVPNNLFMTDVDEKVPGTNLFRFTCADEKDTVELPPTIATRFEREINPCILLDKFGKYNQETFKCDCINHIDNDPEKTCSGTREGFGVPTSIKGSKYGYNLARDCIDIFTDEYNPSQRFITFPCGEKNLRVENALIDVTNTYSPIALEQMLG